MTSSHSEGRTYDITFVLIYIDPATGRDYEIVQSPGFDYDMDPIDTHFAMKATYDTEDKYKVQARAIPSGTSRRFTFRAKFLGASASLVLLICCSVDLLICCLVKARACGCILAGLPKLGGCG